jgi:acetoin utilization deacetylase AcuC-like enzyme
VTLITVCFYACCRVEIIEEMVLFKPDLVIFCAGFDAHDEDPLASVELTEEDFAWATETGNYSYFLNFLS